MGSIDYHRHTLRLETLCPVQRQAEIARFAQFIRVFHYSTDGEHLAPHGGGLSIKMVVRGAETFILQGQRLRLRTGEALLMPPGTEYGSEIAQLTESFSAFFPHRLYVELVGCVHGTSDDLLEMAQRENVLQQPTVPIAADAALIAGLRFASELLELQAYERAEELLQEVALRLLFTTVELQNAEERLVVAHKSQRRELLRRLQRARAYIHDNIVRQVDLECLTEVCHLSRFHLLRSFRQAFGFTPAQYHAELRLRRAALLLKNDQLPVSAVALAVGFRNHSAFSRAWKRRYGYAPSIRISMPNRTC